VAANSTVTVTLAIDQQEVAIEALACRSIRRASYRRL